MPIDVFSLISSVWLPGFFSFAISVVIVLTKRAHLRHTASGHAKAVVQSMHDLPTPRIGGVAIYFGLLIGGIVLSGETAALIWMLVLSAIPVFLAGICEDVGIGASAKLRLVLAMLSSAAMILLSGYAITSGGWSVLDAVLAIAPISFAVTIFATAGVAHAFNLVDGLNGLSTGISLAVAAAFAAIAVLVGDHAVASIAVLLIVVVVGLFLVNYPFGKVFLGDAGAYTLGHVLAWIAVLLMARNPEVSPWALLLATFWPVMDTLASIIRRWRNSASAIEPDRLHFHHLLMRLIERALRRDLANPVATAILAPLFVSPAVIAVICATDTRASILAFFACAFAYAAIRAGIIRYFRPLSRMVLALRRA